VALKTNLVSRMAVKSPLTGPRAATIGLTLLTLFPLIIRDSYWIHIMILALMWAALATSWNLLCGYAGIFSMGHQAFFGIGAYVSALLAMRMGVSPWLGLLLGGMAATAVSLVIAVPTLRLRVAPYVAIATLGFAEVSRIVASNLVGLTRGELGLNGIPGMSAIKLGGFTINFYSRVPSYYLMLLLFAVMLLVVWKIVRSPFGMALKSIRESPDAAEALGVNIPRAKVLVFAISAGMAGIIGGFYAHYIQVLIPSSVLALPLMVEIIAITLIGGLGTLIGPVVGALLLTFGLEYLRFLGDYRMLLYGFILVPLIMFVPEGMVKRILPRRLTS
jgi:branched-chain amino acid transport system permease protein